MTSAEEKKAKTVFGNSLTFSLILVSNALGLNGRAFVALGWPIGIPFVKTRTGTIVNWGNSPSDDTFFHELTHVWQSQHHERAGAYMQNALLSQAAAEAAGGSAYAFIPDRKFMRYGAEQIAQQVERGRSEIIRLIRAVGPLAIAPHNLPFPSIPYWETPGAPGVLT